MRLDPAHVEEIGEKIHVGAAGHATQLGCHLRDVTGNFMLQKPRFLTLDRDGRSLLALIGGMRTNSELCGDAHRTDCPLGRISNCV